MCIRDSQDIEHHWQDNPGQYTSQELVTKDQTILQEIYGKTSRINSFHHQSIKDLADGLEVIARDPKDDIIEAVQSTDERDVYKRQSLDRMLLNRF